MSKDRILIVGAGPSGLCALKELKEVGLDALVVDGRSEFGGIFAPHSNVTLDDDLFLTTSNMFMAYSDFPPADTTIKYWTQQEYYQYLTQYVQHFDLEPHLQLQTTVQQAVFQKSHQNWRVTMIQKPKGGRTPTTVVESFSYLIVATGSNSKPVIPPLFDGFTGTVMHSQDYRDPAKQVQGKKVLVVGVGESATDVATTAARVASSVTVWGRRYPSLAPRFAHDLLDGPMPDEYRCLTKLQTNLTPGQLLESMTTSRIVRNLPLGLWSACLHLLLFDVKTKFGPKSVQQVLYDICIAAYAPDRLSSNFCLIPTKTMALAIAATKGEIDFTIAPRISCRGSTVTLHEPSYFGNTFTQEPTIELKNVDVIVACTGYEFELSWIKPPTPIEPNPRQWFKHCFPLGKATASTNLANHIAFLGYARPHTGGIPQCSELLARYIAQLRLGAKQLPRNMAEQTQRDAACEDELFHTAQHNWVTVDYNPFVMSIARLIGCTPQMPANPWQIVKHWTYPLWPCFFRTQGPGANLAAHDAVLNKFGPYDALAPMPFLGIELVVTLTMPLANLLSYCLNGLIHVGRSKTAGLPRFYRWRMSMGYMMYNELPAWQWDDFLFVGGQVVAAGLIVQHLITSPIVSLWSSILSSLSSSSSSSKKQA